MIELIGKSSSFREQADEFAQPCSVAEVETYFEEEVSSGSVEFQDSEGLDNRGDDHDVKSSITSEKRFPVEPSSLSSSLPDAENLDDMKDDAELSGFYKKDYTDLDYVKVILECSGFADDALQKIWFSSNQPIGPSVFLEVEAYWHKELECSEESFGCYHHQLLFDIVNEKLLNIYDRSYTYYPKPLSSGCYIRLCPKAKRIVDEICKSISTLMSLKPEQKQSLDCIVGLEMGTDDGWMNLQWESECLALELEDSIFDELMEDLEDMIFEEVFGS